MYNNELKKLLDKKDPEKHLRNFALKLFEQQMNKKEIYSIFFGYYQSILEIKEEQANADKLGDVMDMISGDFVGKNIDFNLEKYDPYL